MPFGALYVTFKLVNSKDYKVLKRSLIVKFI